VILAELDVFHSRPYSPTRRVALGRRNLPVDPPPGFGPLLLAGVVAVAADEIDAELAVDLHRLTIQLEDGRRIPQPRLRHRFQTDHVGLARTRALLTGDGERLDFDFDGHGSPLQMALAATYAAGQFPASVRPRTFAMLRKAIRWQGPIGPALITYLSGRTGSQAWSAAAFADPVQWALGVLDLERNGETPPRGEIQRRFREALRRAHPDHGGAHEGAAHRIAEITEARRILLG
jgi:hypothetical protein